MLATIWGCRGSLATPGPATVRYGGNTTCVEVRAQSGAVIVLDAGTGIRLLGAKLAAEQVREIDLLLTHLHLDHVEGLGFFAPLFDPECHVRIHGPRPESGRLEEQIAGYLSPPFFPVPFASIPARVEFVELWQDVFDLDGVHVVSAPVQHPGPTVGYRLEEGTAALAFVPDNEPALDRSSGLELAAGADVLIHDAQYTSEEYATRVGWGHSAQEDVARVIREAAPKRTVLHHHDPSHSDDQLEELERGTRELAGTDAVQLAREQLTLDLSPGLV